MKTKKISELREELDLGGLSVLGVNAKGESVKAPMGNAIVELNNTKANKSGRYPQITAGFADNLVGRGEATPEEFSFRPSAGDVSIEDGTARISAIKGNSVVYNQLIGAGNRDYYPNTLNQDGNVYTLELTASSVTPIIRFTPDALLSNNHKVLVSYSLSIVSEQGFIDAFYAGYVASGTQWLPELTAAQVNSLKSKPMQINSILTLNSDKNTIALGLYEAQYQQTKVPLAKGDKVIISNPQVIDLTLMFGAGNEPTTYEEYLQRKPMNIADEYAYNAGTLVDMKVDSIVSVGDNAWDEEWENGTFDTTTGANMNNADKLLQIRSKNLIKVLPNTNYTCTIPAKIGDDKIWCMLLDKNKEVITGYTVPNAGISGNSFGLASYAPSFTTPANAAYLKFYCVAVYGDVYTDDICFHLEHSEYKNGKYYPYQQDVKDLSFIGKAFPDGMRSAGSAFDEIRYNATTKKWEAVKRIGEVDLGSLNWINGTYNGQSTFVNFDITDSKGQLGWRVLTNSLLIGYTQRDTFSDLVAEDNKVYVLNATGHQIHTFAVRDTSYSDATAFKQAMQEQGVKLYYELAEPIVVEIDNNLNLDYLVWDFGTEEAISNAPSAPFRADIIYQFNAVDRIRNNTTRIAELEAKIASLIGVVNTMQISNISEDEL